MDRQRAKVLLADCHEDPVIDLHALPRIVATRSRSVTGPATLGVGHACERVCKHEYAEIVQLVSDLLANGEKRVPAA